MLMSGMGGGPRGLLDSHGGGEDGKVSRKVIVRLMSFVLPYWLHIAGAGLFMLGSTASGLAIPYLTKVIIDDRILSGDSRGLLMTAALLTGAMLLKYLASMGQTYLLSEAGQRVLMSMRDRLFRHLQELSVAYHDNHIIGVTISRVVNDVGVINNLLTEGLITLIGDSILLASTVVIMITMSPRLALLTFSVIPLMVIATMIFTRKAKSAFRDTREKIAAVVGDLAENIGGMKVIQAFSQEGHTQRRFDKRNEQNRDAAVRAMNLSFMFLPTVDILGILSTCIVLLAGGIMIASGDLTIGIMVAFMSYVTRFFMPIRELSQLYTTLQSASAGGERILGLLDTHPKVEERRDAVAINDLRGEIEFRNVSFAYVPGTEVLHDVSFKVRSGENVAIVGPTGAGKTSIINLVCRFYDVTAGAVLVDGRDIREIALSSLHGNTGYVSQDPFLFAGTIEENIAYGMDGAGRDAVERAARAAEASRFIDRLPNRYETKVMEGGASLSVGQRQLLSIARAILVDPRILIMDEATSSVDTLTEALIQRALKHLLSGRTALIIAHRLSTIRNADRIMVVDDGRIVEEGTHERLMEMNGVYAELYLKQFVGTV